MGRQVTKAFKDQQNLMLENFKMEIETLQGE